MHCRGFGFIDKILFGRGIDFRALYHREKALDDPYLLSQLWCCCDNLEVMGELIWRALGRGCWSSNRGRSTYVSFGRPTWHAGRIWSWFLDCGGCGFASMESLVYVGNLPHGLTRGAINK